jgi:hypothetical protein
MNSPRRKRGTCGAVAPPYDPFFQSNYEVSWDPDELLNECRCHVFEQDESVAVVNELMDDIVKIACTQMVSNYIDRTSVAYTVEHAVIQMLSTIQFVYHDHDTVRDDRGMEWDTEAEPTAVLSDSWIRGQVPTRRIAAATGVVDIKAPVLTQHPKRALKSVLKQQLPPATTTTDITCCCPPRNMASAITKLPIDREAAGDRGSGAIDYDYDGHCITVSTTTNTSTNTSVTSSNRLQFAFLKPVDECSASTTTAQVVVDAAVPLIQRAVDVCSNSEKETLQAMLKLRNDVISTRTHHKLQIAEEEAGIRQQMKRQLQTLPSERKCTIDTITGRIIRIHSVDVNQIVRPSVKVRIDQEYSNFLPAFPTDDHKRPTAVAVAAAPVSSYGNQKKKKKNSCNKSEQQKLNSCNFQTITPTLLSMQHAVPTSGVVLRTDALTIRGDPFKLLPGQPTLTEFVKTFASVHTSPSALRNRRLITGISGEQNEQRDCTILRSAARHVVEVGCQDEMSHDADTVKTQRKLPVSELYKPQPPARRPDIPHRRTTTTTTTTTLSCK